MKYMITISPRQDADFEAIQAANPASAKVVWDLYAAGMVREMYIREDNRGTVFIAEADDVVSLRDALAATPLIQSGQVVGEIVGLQPFTALASAFA